MKKEIAVTAIVFFGVGFLAGYIYDAQKKFDVQQNSALAGGSHPPDEPSAGGATTPAPPPVGTPSGLPEGHPPIDGAAFIKALEDEARKNPGDPEPCLKLANFLYDHKRYDKAAEWYQRALELDPENVSARTDLGTAYFYSGRPEEALREYHKSLETDPRHEPTLYNVIVVNLDGTHNLAAAQEAWERLHNLNPNYPGLDNLTERLRAAGVSRGSTRAAQ